MQLRDTVCAVLGQESSSKCSVVIVANNPENRAFERVAEMPGVEVLEPGLNMGYVGALEWVRRRSTADFLWVLQEDVLPLPDCLEQLLLALDGHRGDAPLAVASPIEVNSDGSASHITRIANFNLDTGVGTRPDGHACERALLALTAEGGRTVTFTYLSGALIDRSALSEIGGFDVNLWPLMWVDLDTCAALQMHGYAVKLVKDARIRHFRAAPRRYPRFHHWKTTASTRNSRYIVAKYSGTEVVDQKADQHIPADILYALSQSMSDFLSEYSEWVHNTSWRAVAWQVKRTLRRIQRMV